MVRVNLLLAILVPLLLVGNHCIGACASNDVRFEPVCGPREEGQFVRHTNRTIPPVAEPITLWQCTDGRALRLNCTTPISDPFRRYFGLCRREDDGDEKDHHHLLRPLLPVVSSSFRCPTGDHEIGAFPMRGNCTHYHFCRGDVHTVRRCAEGMHFDAERGGCNFAHLAVCTRELCPLTSEDGAGDGHGGVWVTLPSNSSCGEFFVCYHGDALVYRCIGDLHWNQAIQDCDLPENVACAIIPSTAAPPTTAAPPPRCPETPGVHQLPHATDCAQFYVCMGDGIAHLRRCPDGLAFDPEIEQCNRIGNFVCALR